MLKDKQLRAVHEDLARGLAQTEVGKDLLRTMSGMDEPKFVGLEFSALQCNDDPQAELRRAFFAALSAYNDGIKEGAFGNREPLTNEQICLAHELLVDLVHQVFSNEGQQQEES